ncbi:hypothetical protein Ancab_039957 [Ancistrocladus abbreviatus]
MGYVNSKDDYSLFHKKTAQSVVLVAVYVDDVLITGTSPADITALKQFLDAQFKIKDLGSLNYFLGIEFLSTPTGLIMTQRKFAKGLLEEFHCTDAAPAASPLPPALKLQPKEGAPIADPLNYRRLIGKLNYLTNTRPDLAFAVQFLSQFMHDPRLPHLEAALHTLRYLSRDPSQGLFFNNRPAFELEAFCDSDWAACPCT